MGSEKLEVNQVTRNRIKSYEADIKDLKMRHVNYQKDIVVLENEKERLNISLEKSRQFTENQKQSIQDIQKSSSQKTEDYKKLWEKFSAKAKRVESLEKELRTLRETHSTQGKDFRELQSSHETLEKQLVEKCKELRKVSMDAEKDSTRNSST